MSAITAIARRELGSYFSTPLAYVFLVIFLVLVVVYLAIAFEWRMALAAFVALGCGVAAVIVAILLVRGVV